MPPGEIPVTCPKCGHRTSLPVAAVRRNNFYCSQCWNKVPLEDVRTGSSDSGPVPVYKKAKKSSRSARRY